MTNSDYPQVVAVIPAAGVSTRFTRLAGAAGQAGKTRKQFLPIEGKPLLVHTLERVWLADTVQLVAVAVPEENLAYAGGLLQPLVPEGVGLMVVVGGETRQASVAAGLEALPQGVEVVVVHDAVRPLFEPRWIRDTVALCRDFDGAIVAVPTTDTLKEVEPVSATAAGSRGTISRTIPRASVWQAQTPQTFRAGILRQALRHAEETGLEGTDEASLVEAVGGRIAVVEGSPHNIKVTTPDDWRYLEWRLSHTGGLRDSDG